MLLEVLAMIREPEKYQAKRLALQVGNQPDINAFFKSCSGVIEREQYLFQFENSNQNNWELPEGFELQKINAHNYEFLYGNITPTFSWRSKEQFLQKGFGFSIFHKEAFGFQVRGKHSLWVKGESI